MKKLGITKPCTHLLQPAHFGLHLALCNTINIIRTKISHIIGQFPQISPKNSKLSILTENWHTWSLGGADLESAFRFWNFDPKIHFWANFGRKSQICLFCLEIGIYDISRILILIPTLVFWISNPKSILGEIWAKKVKFVCFVWKLAFMVSRGYSLFFRN